MTNLKLKAASLLRRICGGNHFQLQIDGLLRHLQNFEKVTAENISILLCRIEEIENQKKHNDDSHPKNHFSLPLKYFTERTTLLETLYTDSPLFRSTDVVFEIECGALRSIEYFKKIPCAYIGLDSSPSKVRLANQLFNGFAQCVLLSPEIIVQYSNSADIVLNISETSKFSVLDRENLLLISKSIIKPDGKIILGSPYPFEELESHEWGIEKQFKRAGIKFTQKQYVTCTPNGQDTFYFFIATGILK